MSSFIWRGKTFCAYVGVQSPFLCTLMSCIYQNAHINTLYLPHMMMTSWVERQWDPVHVIYTNHQKAKISKTNIAIVI